MTPAIQQIMDDPAASDWLKNALEVALERDPVDAANDASVLATVLAHRAERLIEDYVDVQEHYRTMLERFLARTAASTTPHRFSIPEDDTNSDEAP